MPVCGYLAGYFGRCRYPSLAGGPTPYLIIGGGAFALSAEEGFLGQPFVRSAVDAHRATCRAAQFVRRVVTDSTAPNANANGFASL